MTTEQLEAGLKLCEAATPIETWHPENWDAATLSWLKSSAYTDDMAFLKAAIKGYGPALIALRDTAALVKELRDEAKQAETDYHGGDYYEGKSAAYEHAADRLEAILKGTT